METIQLTDKQRELIERLGVFNEQQGIPPTESRIVALMLVSDETELTFDQIRELLGSSKSATSNALNLLLLTQKIKYTTRPGDRKRYFSSNLGCWEDNASHGFKKMLDVNIILREILDNRTPNTPQFNESLRNFIEFMEYLNIELPHLFAKWHDRNKSTNQAL